MTYLIRQDDISAVNLSMRSLNALRRAGIHTIGALLDYPADEFIYIKQLGAKSAGEILACVQALTDGTGEYVLVEGCEQTPDEPRDAEEGTDVDVQCPSEPETVSDVGTATVFLDETGAVVRDLRVQDMELSVRAKNCLTHNGYEFTSQLVGITYEQLMNLKNMGKKTAEEVLSFLEQVSVVCGDCTAPGKDNAAGNELAAELCTAYGETERVWLREVLNVKGRFPAAEGETLLYHLYDGDFVRGSLKSKILRTIEENNHEISKAALEGSLPTHLNNTTILEEILLELESASAVELGETMIYRQYLSVVEFAAQIKDDRMRQVIQGRISGRTLNEIGEQYGITRERVRQLMQKGLRNRTYLKEDKYIDIYNRYDFSPEDFVLAFDEPVEAYHYLEMISKTNRAKRKPLDDILTDTTISPEYRKKAERAIYKQYISVDGVRVKMIRADMVKHFVKTYCRELTAYDVFFQKYHAWLDELGIGDNPAVTVESRTYENYLNQAEYVLWNQWRSFRYYNIPERDFEELLSTLNLERFENVEISTLKLFRDYASLMEQYDIHDEYELHNLLRKIWNPEDSNVKFKKMPTIEIGTVNREEQILSLLLQYTPISGEAFAERYEETYGMKAATILANYMEPFDVYYYDGVYSVDCEALPADRFDRMKAVLDGDFYTMQEVNRLYRREFPNADESLINPYSLKLLGFRVYSTYVIKNTYAGAADYFRSLLTTDDVVDARTIGRSIQNVVAYTSELYKLRSNYEIVEFSPLQYVNIRRLNAAGVIVEHFKRYCEDVFNVCEKGEYFTIASLRRGGFTHELDELGFEEWFYASVLLEDRERFSYQRIGGTRLFLCGRSGANLGEMLVWLLDQYQKIDFYDLKELLEQYYGISLPKEKLLTIIGGTELYYDAIMEAVYIDYDTYFEEI